MTVAVDLERKATKQTKDKTMSFLMDKSILKESYRTKLLYLIKRKFDLPFVKNKDDQFVDIDLESLNVITSKKTF